MNQNNGNTETTRKKLELALEVPVTAKVLHERPFEGENRFGKFFLWTFEVEGEERVFFPDKEANEALLAAGLHAGDSVSLMRKPIQNGKKISSVVIVQALPKEQHTSFESRSANDGRFRLLMEESLRDAIEATKAVNTVPWSGDDIRSIALTIFIQRARA